MITTMPAFLRKIELHVIDLSISTNLLKSKISQLTVIGMSLLCQIKSFLFEYYAFITRDDVYYALNIKIKLYI